MERVFRTSNGWVIVVAMAPWQKEMLKEPSVSLLDSHRAKAGGEVGDEVVSKVVSCQQGLLDLVVEAQLPDRHQDRPGFQFLSIFHFSGRIPQQRLLSQS